MPVQVVLKKWSHSLLLPDTTSDSEIELLTTATREEESHLSMDYEAIMAVTHLPVAIPDTSWHPLPYQLSTIATNLQAVTITLGILIFPHEPKECHVDWSYS
jgi:hypothetical protein